MTEPNKYHKLGPADFIPKQATGELINEETPLRKRIEIMAERAERGEEVFHPQDFSE